MKRSSINEFYDNSGAYKANDPKKQALFDIIEERKSSSSYFSKQ